MATKDTKPDETPDETPGIVLHCVGDGDAGTTLSIGKTTYPIVDNTVKVAPEHYAAALHAGFQP